MKLKLDIPLWNDCVLLHHEENILSLALSLPLSPFLSWSPLAEAGPPARSLLSLPSADCHLLGALPGVPGLYWEALPASPLLGVVIRRGELPVQQPDVCPACVSSQKVTVSSPTSGSERED